MTIEEQLAALAAPLPNDAVKKRDAESGGKRKLSYVEGWYVIETLNRIFGFPKWEQELVDLRIDRYERKGKEGKSVVGIAAVAQVRLVVVFADGTRVTRTDVGVGSNISYRMDLAEASEKAVKEAVTDGLKRCARTLGNCFGLSLSDKDNPLHDGGEDDHGQEPEVEQEKAPPKPGTKTPREKVEPIIDGLLELAAKIDKNFPSKVSSWLDEQIKDLDKLTDDDIKRLVGTKKHPGTLVEYGRELRETVEKRDTKAAA